ncbi:hypothetical protein PMAYCL1PPCAC_13150, partial [Pristionchus mayeri]
LSSTDWTLRRRTEDESDRARRLPTDSAEGRSRRRMCSGPGGGFCAGTFSAAAAGAGLRSAAGVFDLLFDPPVSLVFCSSSMAFAVLRLSAALFSRRFASNSSESSAFLSAEACFFISALRCCRSRSFLPQRKTRVEPMSREASTLAGARRAFIVGEG